VLYFPTDITFWYTSIIINIFGKNMKDPYTFELSKLIAIISMTDMRDEVAFPLEYKS